jgi:hypothetical protein
MFSLNSTDILTLNAQHSEYPKSFLIARIFSATMVPMKIRKNRFLKILLVASPAVVALLLLIVAAMLMAHPRGYDPRPVTEQQGRQAEDYAIAKSQQVYNSVNRIEPFTLSLDEQQINTLILWAYDRWRVSNPGKGPPDFQQPQIHMAGNTLSVRSSVIYKGRSVVLSVDLAPRLLPDGQLEIRLLPIRAGLIPLPRSLTDQYLKEAAGGLSRVPEALGLPGEKKSLAKDPKTNFDWWPTVEPYLNELLANHQVIVPAEVVIDSDVTAKITNITIDKGRLDLTAVPTLIKYK